MIITQLRNATLLVEINEMAILVDPMLAPQGAIPSLKYATRTRRRNPLVGLPPTAPEILEKVTHCLITHCQKGHFDHLDRAGVKWLRERRIPVFCMQQDAAYLKNKGLVVQPIQDQSRQAFLGGRITPIPCVHGEGLVGRFMAHGFGYVMAFPGQPTLYIIGDSIFTDVIERAVETYRPDVIVMPAGGAQFDLGGEIIMGADDVSRMCALSGGVVLANHLEALDHCPVTRAELRARREREGLQDQLVILEDGESWRADIKHRRESRPSQTHAAPQPAE
ncbi:MBL fold metallo-hydrolase [Hahella aquimaris]|uniref:MBL fold metallo-hydrolase n=1 Tax=Hahella sp. HNIBRBA332 TaxID=3015983 RepID=UPI00273B75A3|nr:MBL fold metallo-hydrolase [Hahella sp. HNIBRBA332]WLQ13566.1 MBL fold metallo-hydrolase [Hahella sp. HNIBRBA332]